MKYLFYLLIIILITFPSTLYSQNCDEYHLKNCESISKNFRISNQSRSALFKIGYSSSFSFLSMEGYQYIIHLCSDDNIEGAQLSVSDMTSGEIFTDDIGGNFVIINVKKSAKLTVQVKVPEGNKEIEQYEYSELYGCVGVLIEYIRNKEP